MDVLGPSSSAFSVSGRYHEQYAVELKKWINLYRALRIAKGAFVE